MKAIIHHSVHYHREELCEISKYDKTYDVFNTCVTMTCTVLDKPEGCRFYKFYTRMLHFLEVDWSSLVSYVQGPIEGCCLACE